MQNPTIGIKEVAADLVKHFEARIASLECKAMIVSMSRAICVELFDAIVEDSVKSSHSTNCRRLLSYRPSLNARLLQYVLIGVPIKNGIKGLALRRSAKLSILILKEQFGGVSPSPLTKI